MKYEYFVNKEKRTVACVLRTDTMIGNEKYGVVRIKGKYVGKAKCADEDVFDEAFGKKLAALRAEKAYRKNLRKMWENLADSLRAASEEANEKYLKESERFGYLTSIEYLVTKNGK